jgi:RHS repeat-associated protein
MQHYAYSSFGKIQKIVDKNNVDVTANAPVKTVYSFTNREWDQDAGMYYYRARYYDPGIGRFIQEDPHPGIFHQPMTYNSKYIYTLNNPINRIDPSGALSLFEGLGNLVMLAAIVYVSALTGGTAGAFFGSLAGGGFWGGVVGSIVGAAVGGFFGAQIGGIISVANGNGWGFGAQHGGRLGSIFGGIFGGAAGSRTFVDRSPAGKNGFFKTIGRGLNRSWNRASNFFNNFFTSQFGSQLGSIQDCKMKYESGVSDTFQCGGGLDEEGYGNNIDPFEKMLKE